jgi:hypothetical protein
MVSLLQVTVKGRVVSVNPKRTNIRRYDFIQGHVGQVRLLSQCYDSSCNVSAASDSLHSPTSLWRGTCNQEGLEFASSSCQSTNNLWSCQLRSMQQQQAHCAPIVYGL